MRFLFLILFFSVKGMTFAQNLVINGGFNNFNNIQSDLVYSHSGLVPGEYTVTNKAEPHNSMCVSPPAGNGKFMLIDVNDSSGKRIWYATIQVEADKIYAFSFQASNVNKNFENPSRLRMTVNGANIGNIFVLTGNSKDWMACQAMYRTSSAKEIVIAIENLVNTSQGNDMALDNVSFAEIKEKAYEVPPVPLIKDINEIVSTKKADSIEVISQVMVPVEPVKEDSLSKEKIKPVPVVFVKNKPVVKKTKATSPVIKPVTKGLSKASKPKPLESTIVKDKPIARKKVIEVSSATVAKPVVKEQQPKSGSVKKDSFAIFQKNIKTKTSQEVFSKPPVAGEKLQLENVYFEQSKAVLLPSAYTEIDKLVKYLDFYPSVRIRLEGHTDTHGDVHDNLVLSEQRVQFIKTYLAEKGIQENRIECIGYGSSRPLNSNRIETLRKLNRRVEVVLLSK